MTQEEKLLLLKDLCARLPYGVVMNVTEPGDDRVNFNCFLGPDIIKEIASEVGHFKDKPYLRPMSSMTEEELKEFTSFTSISQHRFFIGDSYFWYNTYEEEDWLNAHHFDYRGLIEKGLALEAPDNMYKTE